MNEEGYAKKFFLGLEGKAPRKVKARPAKEKGKPKGRPAGPDPVERFNVTIPKGLHEKAARKAKAEGVTFSGAVARLLAAWVEK